MKNDLSGLVEVKGNVNQDNAIECTFDASGTQHLMSLLSNLYSDAPLAVLREYSTNALDSHIEAGQTKPIEVLLPTQLRPTLDIKDYGVGLSRKEIIDVYSKYGASTKRDTNEQVGTFGVGSKAAFTIGSQFVVTGVKDGMKTVALFALGDTGVGTVNILSEEPTTEPNGVNVSVGVSKISEIRTAAQTFFSAWEPGTVLVDGSKPDSVWDRSEKITDNIYAYVRSDNTYGAIPPLVVMGGVSYKVSPTILQTLIKKETDPHIRRSLSNITNAYAENLIFKVPIGGVSITPSREDLRDTPLTLKTLRDTIETATTTVATKVQTAINAEKTFYAAAKRAVDQLDNKSTKLIGLDLAGFKWQGRSIPEKVELDNILWITKDWSDKLRTKEYQWFALEHFDPKTLVILTGADLDKPRSIKYRMRQWMDHNDVSEIMAVEEPGVKEWLHYDGTLGAKMMTMDEFKEDLKKVPRDLSAANIKTQYYVYTEKGRERHNAKEIKEMGLPIGYLQYRNFNRGNRYYDEAVKGRAVVILDGKKKLDTLLKVIPTATDFYEDVKTLAEKDFKQISPKDLMDHQLMTMQSDESMYNLFKKLPTSQIKSQTVIDFIKFVEGRKTVNNQDILERASDLRDFGLQIPKVALPYQEPDWNTEFPLIPLIQGHAYRLETHPQKAKAYQHLVTYINAVGY